jgi:DNA-binding NtrC family response regulator
MSAESKTIRILLIRAWTEPFALFRAALRAAGIHVRIARVDIEPALNAALGRGSYDAIVFDPTTPGISHDVIEARLREHARFIPIVVVAPGSLDSLANAIKHTLDAKLN